MSTVYLIAAAFVFAGLGYLFASRRTNTAVRVLRPLNKGRLVLSAIFGAITLWVALRSGGFVRALAFVALILLGSAAYLMRDTSTDLSA